MVRRIGFGALLALVAVVGGLARFDQAQAQFDSFTFFIPFNADRLGIQFGEGRADQAVYQDSDIEVTVSIAVLRDNTIIYYDHWEDGLESDLTSPTQATTRVWGDGDPNNNGPFAVAPGIPADDILRAGTIITLNNDVLVPRTDPLTQIFFDGGDKLTALGGAVEITTAAWPIRNPPINGSQVRVLYADAWELFPTSQWGQDYVIPIGQNLVAQRGGFTVVGINVQAAQDNTQVEVDLDGVAPAEISQTLDQGEQLTSLSNVDVGARITTSGPVQVHVVATDPTQTYELRGYTMLPVDQWTDQYLASRSSDGDFWLYNPDNSDLAVSAQTITTTTALTIPARSTIKFPAAGLNPATGLLFSAPDGRHFYGAAALDANSAQDWGYALIPSDDLTTQVLVGWGIGNYNKPSDGDQSHLYVTAVNTTTLSVDYNNDGTVDNTITVNPLGETPIIDPDHDMTGAFIYSNNDVPFAVVWGQDQSADPALPSIDAGSNVLPLPRVSIKNSFGLVADTDCTGSITHGDTVLFSLQYFNNSVNPVLGLIIKNNLPAQFTYLPNSTLVNGVPLADATSGTPFQLDEDGYVSDPLSPRSAGLLTFKAIAAGPAATVTNQSQLILPISSLVVDSATTQVPIEPPIPAVTFKKSLLEPADGVISAGQVVTFGMVITNTGSTTATLTEVPLEDTFDPNVLTFRAADPPPDITSTGVITWSDLTNIFGDLTPGAVMNTVASFVVNPNLPVGITSTINSAALTEAQRDNNVRVLNCRAEASAAVVPTATATATPTGTPTATATATPTSTPTPKRDRETRTPPPTTPAVTQTPVGLVTPTAVSTVFPVALLPETGLQGGQSLAGLGLLLAVIALAGLTLALKRRQAKSEKV